MPNRRSASAASASAGTAAAARRRRRPRSPPAADSDSGSRPRLVASLRRRRRPGVPRGFAGLRRLRRPGGWTRPPRVGPARRPTPRPGSASSRSRRRRARRRRAPRRRSRRARPADSTGARLGAGASGSPAGPRRFGCGVLAHRLSGRSSGRSGSGKSRAIPLVVVHACVALLRPGLGDPADHSRRSATAGRCLQPAFQRAEEAQAIGPADLRPPTPAPGAASARGRCRAR